VLKNYFFADILKVNDENSRIRIQDPDPDPNPDPDPLVRGMDPRIRIHPKMSWIRNTACHAGQYPCHTGHVPVTHPVFRSGMFIPDPNFSIRDPGSRVKKIPDPGSGSASNNLTQKIVSKLSEI
jgi:hypothetical protein